MVRLTKIYTRTGDKGHTRLVGGRKVAKSNVRVEAYGGVDEANSCIGLARLHTAGDDVLDPILARIQNDLFDLGSDLANPVESEGALRILQSQVVRLEREIDQLNAELSPLNSFILPGGSPAGAALHLARTVARRAERGAVRLTEDPDEHVSEPAMKYLNRLSDLLFVAARWANQKGATDVLWVPGGTR